MTEEEKEAIEEFKNWIKIVEDNKDKIKKANLMVNIQETILNLIQKQQEELEKKDKIIDEMAIFMSNMDIDEEICKHQIATFCDDKTEGVTLDICAKCIKEYFERKVEEIKQC